MEHPVVPSRVYILTYVGLIILLGLTVGAAYVDFGTMNAFVTLAIAIVKALLVILFFMHVWYSSRLTKLFVFAGLFWLLILFLLLLGDYVNRALA